MERNGHRKRLLASIFIVILCQVVSKGIPPHRFGIDARERITASKFARGSPNPRNPNPCVGSHLPCLHSNGPTTRGRSFNLRKSKTKDSFEPSQPVFFAKTMREALSPNPNIKSPNMAIKTLNRLNDTINCRKGINASFCRQEATHVSDVIKDKHEVKTKMFILTTKPTLTAILVQSKNRRLLDMLTKNTILDHLALPSQSEHIYNQVKKGDLISPAEFVPNNQNFGKGQNNGARIYDKCSHPFHAWQCSDRRGAGAKNRVSAGAKKSTTQVPKKSPKSNPRPNFETVSTNAAFVKKVNPSNSKDYDKCSHPFHSWLCDKRRSSADKVNTIAKPQPSTIAKPTIVPNTTPTYVKTGKALEHAQKTAPKYNKCSHAFHSWLCPKSKNRVEPPKPSPTNKVSSPTKINLTNSGKSIDSPAKTTTTKAPQNTYNKCNHAFHSWLCRSATKSKSNLAPTTTPKPSTAKFANKLTTILPNLAKAQQTVTNVNTKYDKCSHPFHSWLCQGTQRQRQTKQRGSSISKSLSQNPKTPKKDKESNKEETCSGSQNLGCKRAQPQDAQQPSKNDGIIGNQADHTGKDSKKGSNPNNKKCEDASNKFPCEAEGNLAKPKTEPTNEHKESSETKLPSKTTSVQRPKIHPFISTTPLSIHYADSNPCNHAFHSWLCRENSRRIQNIIKTVTPKPKTPSKSLSDKKTSAAPAKAKVPRGGTGKSWDGANPCTHSFHAWLCQPLRPRLVGSRFLPPTTQFTSRTKDRNWKSTAKNTDAKKSTDPPTQTNEEKQNTETPLKPNFNLLPKSYSLEEAKAKSVSHTEDTLKSHCNHLFHPWMCSTFANRHPDFPLLEIPNIRSLPLENEEGGRSTPSLKSRLPRLVRKVEAIQATSQLKLDLGKDGEFSPDTKRKKETPGSRAAQSKDKFEFSIMDHLQFESKRISPKVRQK